MKKIGFDVDEEIANLDKKKKQQSKQPQLKVQRIGTEWVEFYLERPFHFR